MIELIKKTNVYIFIGTVVQLVIYSFFFQSFFRANQFSAKAQDYLYLSLYIFAIFFIAKHFFQIIILPLVRLLSAERYNRYIQLGHEIIWISFSIVDCIVYDLQGVHVYDRDVLEVLGTPEIYKVFNITLTTYASLGIGLAILAAILFSIFVFVDKRFVRLLRGIIVAEAVVTLLVATLSFNFFHAYSRQRGEVLSLYPLLVLIRQRPSNEPLTLNYDTSALKNIKLKKRPNIIYVLTESLRAEIFNAESMPKLFEFFSRKNCLSPDRAFSGGHTTVYGVFSGLYGLWGYHYANFKEKRALPGGIEILKSNGYKVWGGVSAATKFHQYNQAGFMFKGLDEYKELVGIRGKMYESDQALLRWGSKQIINNSKNPFFMFTFIFSTHSNYIYPPEYERFLPVAEKDFNHLSIMSGDGREERLKLIYNRYKNASYFVDSMVYDYLNSISQDVLANSVVVFTGDHGQEFGEEGAWGHAKTNYINPKVKIPMALCMPEEYQIKKGPNIPIAAHVDIFPTILDYALEEDAVAESIIDKYFNGVSLLRRPQDGRYLVVTSPLFPYERNKLGIITSQYKFWLKKTTETLDHYYLYRIADLDDKKVSGSQSYKFIYQDVMNRFTKDAYKFLQRP